MTPAPVLRPSLDADRLAAAGIEALEEATSTNAVVADRARAGAPEGLVVVAESQTAGRGRLDRSWQTPPRAALLFSVLLRPQVAPRSWPWLPLLTGCAVADVVHAAGVDVSLKWPNDLLVGDRKLAGILVERVETATGPAAVVGIGLNVSLTAAELPVPTATSLALEGVGVDRTELLLALVAGLLEAQRAWQGGGEAATGRLRAAYVAACGTLGRAVRIERPDGPLEGTATGIDADGRLLVAAGGTTTALSAGDVVHVRSPR